MTHPDGYWITQDGHGNPLNLWITGTNQVITGIHKPSQCAGDECVIHNPSTHHLRHMPTHYRQDTGITERICEHGTGHPDPDDPTTDVVHGCCGCCRESETSD